jgi:polysaccharide export outer membrane protein
MRKSLIKRFCLFAPVLFLSLTIISCSTIKNVKYFQDIPDSGALKTIPVSAYTEPKIQVDDILTIIVVTVDPSATQAINSGNIAISGGASPGANITGGQATVTGYLVNKNGNVEVPVLGEIKVAGLTTEEARLNIKTRAGLFYNDPSVIVRYANFKITVMGEVARPSIYVMPNEKVTLLDALSIAGDLTIYGKRDNVLLLREGADGTKTTYRINLNKSNIISEPYYYLRQNDYIYVEPTRGKAAANDVAQTRNITIFTALLTLLAVVISRISIH